MVDAGGSSEVRQGGIDLLPLYRSAKVGLFDDLSDLGEPARQLSPVFSLIFDFRQTKFIAFLGLAPLHQCLAR